MRISVVIPCYNARPYLGQTLGSVLEQTRLPDEVIVADDGSTDGSRRIAEAFGEAVRVVSKRQGSAAKTRNYGASFATGDALMFLDADDVLGPMALAALAEEVERHPDSVAACPWYRLDLNGGAWVRQPASCASRAPDQDFLDAWLRGWYHPPCAVLWSRAAYERTSGWPPDVGVNDDGYVMMQALARNVPLRLTTAGEAFYRRLPQGEVSLSGTRFTEEGIRSRLWVLKRIAQMLAEQGRLDGYRPAFTYAFTLVAHDCEGRHPELANTCARLQRRYGELVWTRAVRSLRGRTHVYFRRLRRVMAPRLVKTSSKESLETIDEVPPEEIQYGLEQARRHGV